MRRLSTLWLFLFFFSTQVTWANEGHDKTDDESFNVNEIILEHISDSHEWHFFDYNGKAFSLPLPVILWDNGLKTFMSSEFEHGHKVVQKGDSYYAIQHEKIYKTDASGTLEMDQEGHPTNEMPLDFSITKNVAGMFLSAIILMIVFISVARSYKDGLMPKSKLAKLMEPLIVFVREEIAIPNIGLDKYKKYMPYLLTIFFFIWINNLLGLIPGAANVTGNIAVTAALAVTALLVINLNANASYWKHIFWMPGVPVPVKIMLAPIELIGVFTRPFALMIRLFANISAGHIVILSLVSLIFIFKTLWVAPGSVLLVLFINTLELLVAALQAFIFTLLTALFIGMAVEDAHDEDAEH